MTGVAILGTGAVGQAVAASLTSARFGRRIVLLSRTAGQTAACASDVQDMAATLRSRTAVYAANTVDELRDCDGMVIAVRAAFASRPGEDMRLAGLCHNAELVHRLGVQLRGYQGVLLMVTNPVDVMARLLSATSGCQVYGVGAGLDTARYRALLGTAYGVPTRLVDGLVIGEHGDAAVCCLSTTRIDGAPVDPADPRTRTALAAFTDRPMMIMGGVGRVRAGAVGSVLSALRATVGGVDGLEPLSTRYGDHSWLGHPVRFIDGTGQPRLPLLSELELQQIDSADQKLRGYYAAIQEHLSTLDIEDVKR